ncbi:MAG: hypothetical protein AAF411_19630, partial [Myxococcota bacterium]
MGASFCARGVGVERGRRCDDDERLFGAREGQRRAALVAREAAEARERQHHDVLLEAAEPVDAGHVDGLGQRRHEPARLDAVRGHHAEVRGLALSEETVDDRRHR